RPTPRVAPGEPGEAVGEVAEGIPTRFRTPARVARHTRPGGTARPSGPRRIVGGFPDRAAVEHDAAARRSLLPHRCRSRARPDREGGQAPYGRVRDEVLAGAGALEGVLELGH